MTRPGPDRTATLLASPRTAEQLTPGDWSGVIYEARQAGLLARLAVRLMPASGTAPWPTAVTGHFESALRLSEAQQSEIRREAKYIVRALGELGVPVVLLKGAAYTLAGLPAASGRVFGDIDILVPKGALAQAESQLLMHGWLGTHDAEYDQKYYRQWMHELPPLQHTQRGTVLDVHHSILPETARLRPDPRLLFERARPLADLQGLHVLAPEDMVLHSMTHLFMNDDMTHALRDLSDLDLLLRHFGVREDFWQELPCRARALNLVRPLYYGLRYCPMMFNTPVPDKVVRTVAEHAPSPWLVHLMDAIWTRTLRSPHRRARPRGSGLALFALYVRGHWLRMPPVLLARHLLIKAWMRLTQRTDRPRVPGP
jgi:Uncharacterised nucleotidyltransferase